ncbi:hypothetical protein ACLB2K_071888 [Fragaria x ananassa]
MDLAIFGDQPEVSREQLMALQNESSGFGVKLDDTNYPVWRRLMKMHLGGVGKWEYVAGTLQRPEEVGKAQAMWDAANSNTMVLLLKSMTRPIMLLFSTIRRQRQSGMQSQPHTMIGVILHEFMS